jgi:hypothetical protein
MRVRFAPSPTGAFHVGNARTYLASYVLARQQGGQLVLKVDDAYTAPFFIAIYQLTPEDREKWTAYTLRAIDWLGLTPDETVLERDLILRRGELAQRVKQATYPCWCRTRDCYVCPPECLEECQANPWERDDAPVYRLRHRGSYRSGHTWFDLTNPIVLDVADRFLYGWDTAIDDVVLGITHVVRSESIRILDACDQLIAEVLGVPPVRNVFCPDVYDAGIDGLHVLSKSLGARGILHWADTVSPAALISALFLSLQPQEQPPHLLALDEMIDQFDPKKFQDSHPVGEDAIIRLALSLQSPPLGHCRPRRLCSNDVPTSPTPEHPVICFEVSPSLDRAGAERLGEVGVEAVQAMVNWWEVESGSARGPKTWANYDRYVEEITGAGLKLILRLPHGAPRWAPEELFLRGRFGSNYAARDCNRFMSLWHKDARVLTQEFIEEACARYAGENVILGPCLGYCGETPFPVHMGDDYYQLNGRSLWCRDEAAVTDFRRYREARIGPVQCAGPADFDDDPTTWPATIAWLTDSVSRWHREFGEVFLEHTSQRELWLATVPRSGFAEAHLDAGMFEQEIWQEQWRQALCKRGIALRFVWYSIFLTDPGCLAYHYWLAHRYGWRTWVGAETAQNIVANSERAMKAGLAGVVVGNPFSGPYGQTDQTAALRSIEQAVVMWRQARRGVGSTTRETL